MKSNFVQAAVLGKPISHSLSPVIHNAAYRELDIEGSYTAIEIDEESFSDFIQDKFELGWAGFSLTMPLKESIARYGFSLDAKAKQIGSANTLYRGAGGYLGYSTDYSAFLRLLPELATKDDPVVLLGAGGTARAALGALGELGFNEVYVFGRSPERLDALQQAYGQSGLNYLPLTELATAPEKTALTLNTIPGNLLQPNLQPRGALFEVLYHPWPTSIVQAWQDRKLPVISGKRLLVEQALDQIQLMTGRYFDFAALRQQLLALIGA